MSNRKCYWGGRGNATGKSYPNLPQNYSFNSKSCVKCPDDAKTLVLPGDGNLAMFRTKVDNGRPKKCNGCGAEGGIVPEFVYGDSRFYRLL